MLLSFIKHNFPKSSNKSELQKFQRTTHIKHRLSSSLIIIMLLTSMLVVILPVSNVGAQPDGIEYFVTSPPPNIQRIDEDMDGYLETARIYYDVDSSVAYAEIKVICSVYDDGSSTLVKQISETYTIFGKQEIHDSYFDYRASFSGVYNFSLAVYDIQHGNTKENFGNNYDVGNTTLEVNPYQYRIIAEATAYDADADGYNDDVRITALDTLNYTLGNAEVYIDGYYEGTTDRAGELLSFNHDRSIHEVDIFYRGLHGNTDFKSEGTGQQLKIYADADPYDEDQDGYIDDVIIRVYTFNFEPLPNVDVYIDYYYYGTTNQQGLLNAYNFEGDFHDVWVQFNNFNDFTTFYSEAEDVASVNMYFFSVFGEVSALDDDKLANDLDIYIDVDIEDGKTADVTVNATLYYENKTIAAEESINYTTTGYEVENKHIYIYNLTNNLTYYLKFELMNETGDLKDVRYQENIVIQIAYGLINVDMYVFDLNDDDHYNDVSFWAHIKNKGYTSAYIHLFWESNNTLSHNLTTDFSDGHVVVTDLFYTNYTWIAYDEKNNTIDNGTFELYDRNPFRTAQVRVQLNDLDRDGFFDDFEVVAYNDLGLREINVSVQVVDFTTQAVVVQGYTTDPAPGPRRDSRFIANDLPEGFYTYTANIVYILGNPKSVLLTTGWFYSYGNSTEATRNLNAFAINFDADSDGYKNDVQVQVTDRNNQPVMNAIVYYDGDFQNSNTTDMNGRTIGKDFGFGWHDVDVRFLGSSSTVPTGARAFTRFYSEGENFNEYFWWAEGQVVDANSDGEYNDLNISINANVDDFVEVEVTVEIEIHYETNDSVAAQTVLKYFIRGYGMNNQFIQIYNLSYNQKYYANYTLKDDHGLIEDEANQTNIVIVPIMPVINIEVTLYNSSWVDPRSGPGVYQLIPRTLNFYAHITTNGVENITISIHFKSNDTKVAELITDESGHALIFGLEDDEYYFKVSNGTQPNIEYGEFNIGHIVALNEMELDYDDDGYNDDMSYYARQQNVTIESAPPSIVYQSWSIDLDVFIYDLNDNIIAQGNTNNTNWTYVVYNLTEGHFKYKTSYFGLRVTNGTFYSYGNGFENLPPEAIIRKPADSSKWSTEDTIQFDGSTSYDPDSDVITYYWYSNRTVNGGKDLSTKAKFSKQLPAGVHKITLQVDDGYGHVVSDFVTITVSAPIINVSNDKPVADAGDDQTNKPVDNMVTLDGTGSYDNDGHITEYNWTMTAKPSGSAAVLNNTNYVKPTFLPDKIGTYTCTLGVKDNNSEWSVVEDTVDIFVIENSIPIVNISIPLNMDIYNTTDVIFFESNGTYDPDDDFNSNGIIDGLEIDNLTYTWSIRRGNETPMYTSHKANFNTTDINTYPAFPAGIYFINLTVNDVFMANASTEVEINITNVPPKANITAPTEGEMIWKYSEITFDGTASEDLDNFTSELYFYWELKPSGKSPIIFANDSQPNLEEGLDEGDYELTLWVDDSYGTDLFGREHNVSTMVNFTVENRAPFVDAGVGSKINLGEVAYFNGSGSYDLDGWRDEENFTYTWDFGDGSDTKTGLAVNHTYLNLDAEINTYVVNLTVDDGSQNNNTAWDNLTMIVNNLPNPDAGDDIEDAMVGEKILLDGSDSWDLDMDDTLLYKWTFEDDDPNDDTAWNTDPYTNVTYDNAGEYIVTLNVTDGFGWANDTLTVTVIKPNSPPFCLAPKDIEDVDIDELIFFSGFNCSDLDDEDELIYTWDFGDGMPEQQGQNVTHSYSENGLYTVILNFTDGEAWAEDQLTVSVRPEKPVIAFPDDNADVFSIVIISGTTEGNNISLVEVKIGSKSWDDADDESSNDDWSEWSYEWDTTKDTKSCEYIILVRVGTEYGATTETTSITVNLELEVEPELLSITIEEPTSSKVKDRVTISGVTTGENIVRVEIQLGANEDWIEVTDDSASNEEPWSKWSYEWNTQRVDDKRYVITVQVTDQNDDSKTDTKSLTVENEGGDGDDPDEEPEDQGGIMDLLMNNIMIVAIVIVILILLIIALMVSRSKKQRLREKEEELSLLVEEEKAEKEKEKESKLVETEMEEEEGISQLVRQPIKCPKCQEYSVIEDDGERPLMVECVHCGSKGYISAKPKTLGEVALPKKDEKEEEKLIIQCPKCDEMFTADDETGEIACPNCGIRGKLSEEMIDELRKQQEIEFTTEGPGTGAGAGGMDKKSSELSMDYRPPQLPPSKSKDTDDSDKEEDKRNVRCPNCDTKFGIAQDATEIECPSCGATGSL